MPGRAAAEAAAFAHLVERDQAFVFAIALARTADAGLAEDVTQETFLAAWRQRGVLRDAAKWRPWLAAAVAAGWLLLVGPAWWWERRLRQPAALPGDGPAPR